MIISASDDLEAWETVIFNSTLDALPPLENGRISISDTESPSSRPRFLRLEYEIGGE